MGKVLAEARRKQLVKKNVAKMLHLFEEKIELQAEMLFVISFGKVFLGFNTLLFGFYNTVL